MPSPPDAETWAQWAQELRDKDRVIARLFERHGPPTPSWQAGSAFSALARSIVYQQLAGAAARTIWARVESTVGRPFTAERVLATDDDALRAAGLSAAKLRAVRDLSERAASGELRLSGLSRVTDDEEVIRRLVVVRGVGRWTAEMFLLFKLRRPDVWPTNDYGVQKGFMLAHRRRALPSPKDLLEEGERFRPYRSVAAWYLWRAAEEK